MRIRSLAISATLISVLVLALAVIALAADPFVGTWKMNLAKSKFSLRPLKSFTSIIETQNSGIQIVQDLVDADGKVTHRSWTAKADGKDYPVTGDPDADSYSFTKPNANTNDYVFKKSGKEAHRGQTVVSKNGKTSIITGGGKEANGQAFTYTIVMEKQ
jgi:hypothetical protein